MKRKLEIILAIAAKDIVDAFKNRALLSVFIGVGFLLLANMAMPLVMNAALDPVLVVFDEGQSEAIEGISKGAFEKVIVPTGEACKQVLSESLKLALGVVIPADFDVQLAAGDGLTLEAYYMSWESNADLEKMVFFFEEQLSLAFDHDIRLQVEGNEIYPPISTRGKAATSAVSLVLVIVMFSMITVPFLIQDEKEKKTMDVLLISPATLWQVVLGKAIAGMLYGIVAAVLVLLFSQAYIQLWGLALLSTIMGIVFAVSAGLLLGVMFDSAQNLSLVMGLFMALLILPVILLLTALEIPSWIQAVLSVIPTDNLVQNYLISFGDHWAWRPVMINLGMLAGFSLLFIALAVWHIRKSIER